MLEVCLLQDYHFSQEYLFRRNLLSSVLTCEKRDREKKLAKFFFRCTSVYVRRQKHVLNGCF